MSHGQGARLYDVDGREYIDWMMAFGALPLGHAHPAIVETVSREILRGSHFATALEVEVEVAEMLVALLPQKSVALQIFSPGKIPLISSIR